MSDPQDLEQRLAAAAHTVHTAGDLDAVLVAARRSRTRRRAAAGVAVAAVVALAGVGGYQAGRGSDDGSRGAVASESTAGAASDAAGQGTTPGDAPPASTAVAEETSATADTVAAAGPWPATTAVPISDGEAKSSETAMAVDTAFGGMTLYSALNNFGTPHETVVERTVGDVRLVVSVARFPAEQMDIQFEGGWKPPAWCSPMGATQILVSGPADLDLLSGPWFAELKDGVGVTGGVSKNGRVGVAQVSDPAVTSVDVTYADGATDSAPVTNGFAVWYVPSPGAVPATITFVGGNHPPLESTELGRLDKACMPPPPALPPAGEQPADPSAAEAAVRDVANRAFDGVSDLPNEFDDVTGLQAAIDEVQNGGFAASAEGARMEVDEIVFTSPTEAWLRYDLVTSVSTFPNHFGRAVLIDGQWKLTRQTLCQEVEMAGVQCQPSAGGSIEPPGG